MGKYRVSLTFHYIVEASEEDDVFAAASKQFSVDYGANASNADDITVEELPND